MNFIVLQEMLSDWPNGTCTVIPIIMIFMMIAAFIVYELFTLIDSCFLFKTRGMGRIVKKTFVPAHTEMMQIYSEETGTFIPQPVIYPEDWSVSVKVESRQSNMSIGKELYDLLSEGDSVMVGYAHGRFSGGLYLKELSRV
jgi:hypothetical protein